MNKKRVNFEQPAGHQIKITPYWLLGLIEGEGYFSIATKDYRTMFGLGLTAVESKVLEGIKEYLMVLLPPAGEGKYKITRKDTNIVSVMVDSKAKDTNSKPMAKLSSYKTDYLSNVLVPFLDSLTWLSKKFLDYEDWKLVLEIKNQGKHFTEEGKEVILILVNRMNNNRLSTSKIDKGEIKYVAAANLDKRILNLLSTPSNYELQADGKILIKSTGSYLKGRGNISVIAIDEKGEVQHNFGSIKNCALFFKVDPSGASFAGYRGGAAPSRTIIRRLDKGSIFEYNGVNLVLKRDVSDLKFG
uniref:LAGLIDADG endonuclease n=1 Tax=Juglanconis juglandina TaxID=1940567 RepID=A0A291LJE3_9PEZI|nr:LAGLIDADG endonuclease [Juglanconis juglandina]